MKNRQLDATLQSAGLGVAAIRDLASAVEIVVVEVPAVHVEKIGAPYIKATIPANTCRIGILTSTSGIITSPTPPLVAPWTMRRANASRLWWCWHSPGVHDRFLCAMPQCGRMLHPRRTGRPRAESRLESPCQMSVSRSTAR